MFVVNFNERARRGLPDSRPFSGQIDELRAALWQGVPQGRTALYDAIELSLRQLEMGRRAKKALVVISDGGDNVSTRTLKEVMHDTLESLATIYTVGIFDEDDPERNPKVLERFAHVSGGAVYFPKQLEQVGPICKQIAKDIRTRYTIGYIPPAEGKPERGIKVVASAAGHGKLIVRTRTRYLFAPDNAVAETK
jgi:VWFA-related protein